MSKTSLAMKTEFIVCFSNKTISFYQFPTMRTKACDWVSISGVEFAENGVERR